MPVLFFSGISVWSECALFIKDFFMRRVLMVVASTGWLLPIWISVQCLFEELKAEIWARIQGQHPLNSFPFSQCREYAFVIGFIWLAIAVIFWVWRITWVVQSGKASGADEKIKQPAGERNSPTGS